MIYVADSESNGVAPHPGWKRGIRIGSLKDGKVLYRIPDPLEMKGTSAAEGVAVDAKGNVYGGEVGPRQIGEAHRRSGPLRARKTYARSMYAPSLVLTLIFSPELTKGGTWTISPVSVLAGLNEVVTVAFLMLGSVSVTVSTTEGGSSTPIGRSL